MAMRIAVIALRNAAEARTNTRNPIRLTHSTRSRIVIFRSLDRHPTPVNSFLPPKCYSISKTKLLHSLALPLRLACTLTLLDSFTLILPNSQLQAPASNLDL